MQICVYRQRFVITFLQLSVGIKNWQGNFKIVDDLFVK